MKFVVALDGSRDFISVTEAVHASKEYDLESVTIYIKEGIYKEKLFIEQDHIRLIGEDPKKTIITYDDYGYKNLGNGEKMGTFRSYTAFAGGDDFRAENITFENSAGCGTNVGQGIAMYANGDKAIFKNCNFLGSQDTLFTGHLPLKEILPGGFTGPGEYLERKPTSQFYDHCYIKGDVDFIFGSAKAVFYQCEIESINRNMKENGYITAPSTPMGQDCGYVFIECKLTSHAAPETVYLGRPWRNHGKAAFINCWMGAHIHRAGWHNWDKKAAEDTVEFVEYNSQGPGGKMNERVKWARILNGKEAEKYGLENCFKNIF